MPQVTGCQDMYVGKRLLRHDGNRKGRRGVTGMLEPGASLEKEETGRVAQGKIWWCLSQTAQIAVPGLIAQSEAQAREAGS